MKKRLTKSRDQKLCGVFGGIAEYLNVDPTIVRLIGLLLILATGGVTGMIMYFGADLIMPDPPKVDPTMDGKFTKDDDTKED